MRAILILGVMLMPWQDDLNTVSAAIAQQGPQGQQAQMAQQAPMPPTRPPELIPMPPLEQKLRQLDALARAGKISPLEHDRQADRLQETATQQEKDAAAMYFARTLPELQPGGVLYGRRPQ